MKAHEINFLEYLGVEEQNLLTSIINFRNEFDLFYNLDRIYKEPLARLEVAEENQILIPQFYLFVHYHLYFSVSCLLRAHLSECLSSIRTAIDAALSAYKIILEPATAIRYIERDKEFLHIKSHIKNVIEKDSSQYPLAQRLIKIHEQCSAYGSHADINSFIHRLETKATTGASKGEMQLHYFQFPSKKEEYQFYFVVTLQSFFLMFKIFKIFLDASLRIVDTEWEKVIGWLERKLEELGKNHLSQST